MYIASMNSSLFISVCQMFAVFAQRFSKFEWVPCRQLESQFRMFTDVSLDGCVVACEGRPVCEAVMYSSRLRFCELLDSSDMADSKSGNTDTQCKVIKKTNFLKQGVDTCSSSDSNDLKSTTCHREECEPVRNVAHGKILGNRYDVGAKLRVLCDQGYVEENDIPSLTCGERAVWSHVPACVPFPTAAECSNEVWTGPADARYKIRLILTMGIMSEVNATCNGWGGYLARVDSAAKLAFISALIHTCSRDHKRYHVDGWKVGNRWLFQNGVEMNLSRELWLKEEPDKNDICSVLYNAEGNIVLRGRIPYLCQSKDMAVCEMYLS